MSKQVVTIRVRNVGQAFGCIGQLVARNGRVLAETDTMPYGMPHAARISAEALAERLGFTVREVAS